MKTFLSIIIISISFSLYSQTKSNIKLLKSNELILGPADSNYWVCKGNVVFKHNNTIMECDSSYHYKNSNKIIAFSNIKIEKEKSLKVYGNKLIYYGNKNSGEIIDSVVLYRGETKLKTNKIKFNLDSNIIYYKEKTKIIDNKLEIESNKGWYEIDKKIFYFREEVVLNYKKVNIISDTLNYFLKEKIMTFHGPTKISNLNLEMFSDKLTYDPEKNHMVLKKNNIIFKNQYQIRADSIFNNINTNFSKAFHNVSIHDTTNKSMILGDTAEHYNSFNSIIVKSNSMIKSPQKTDTLQIKADNIIVEENCILAFPNVIIYKKEMIGRCDSLSYKTIDSNIELFKKPILWFNDMQISADSMIMYTKNNDLEKILLFPNPFIIKPTDSEFFNQIIGKEIIAYMKNNKIDLISILGNSKSIYVLREEENKEIIGINITESYGMRLNFKEKRINKITYTNEPISKTIPKKDITEKNKKLENFSWRINEKPK
ncbi:MAG: hypothetical protein CMP51_01665 [Flavobacteriales bacterium]|nr:hypothetical protein [Flavobacteriales bacterium]